MAYDPTSGLMRDQVRLMIGDTDDANLIFTDDEIDLFISTAQNDEYAAAGLACYSLAATKARLAIAIKAGGDFSIDRKTAADKLRLQGDTFFKQAESVPHCREVHLEDKDISFIDSLGGNNFSFDTRNSEFNNP